MLSAAAGAVGYGLIQAISQADGQYVESFAAGAVLTMLADSMIPEAFEQGGKRIPRLLGSQTNRLRSSKHVEAFNEVAT